MMPWASAFKLLATFQLVADLQCPTAYVLDVLCMVILFISLLVLALALEAVVAMQGAGPLPEEDRSAWLDDSAINIRSPWQHFKTGFGWSAGFVGCLMTLQTVTLLYVEKSAVPESLVWAIIFFPCLLAVLGPVWLMKLMCQKQLTDMFLTRRVLLLDPPSSTLIKSLLMLALGVYALMVLGSVAAVSCEGLFVVLGALLGPSWTLLKALAMGTEAEDQLKQVEVWKGKLKNLSTELPKLREMSWSDWPQEGELSFASVSFIQSSTAHRPGFFHNIFWHRTAVRQLGASNVGFCVLPSFIAIVGIFLAVSFLQAARFMCSRGQLLDLELATDLHAVTFAQHQSKYAVHMDTSFTQVVMLAMADVTSTRWISLQQPSTARGTASAHEQGLEIRGKSFGSEELQLSQALIPRISRVQAKGLRPSLQAKEYFVRFSPMQTLPSHVTVSKENFTARVAWSTLPGSIMSLPEGVDSFDIHVNLLDFFLGIPADANREPSAMADMLQWTSFQAAPNATESWCQHVCEARPECLRSFFGQGGCYFACHHHDRIQRFLPSLVSGRKLSGQLDGCRRSEVERCKEVVAQEHLLIFKDVPPDWRGANAQLSLSLVLQVGGQRFIANSGTLELRRGLPAPSDAFVLLDDGEAMKTATTIDGFGNVIITASYYDPLKITSLNLSVLPMLPDRAFEVVWTPAQLQTDAPALKLLQQGGRCKESAMVYHRYALCGAQGDLQDVPSTVGVSPWTGQLEAPLQFVVALRSKDLQVWPEAPVQTVQLKFDGVDSPAAWAAQHGCKVLDHPLANRSIVASADATCKLLAECPEQLCPLVDEQGLGGSSDIGDYSLGQPVERAPLLSQNAIAHVMICMHGLNACTKTRWPWGYEYGELYLHQHGAKMAVNALLSEVLQAGTRGLEFLQHMIMTSLDSENSYFWILSDLARAIWELPSLTAQLVKTVASLDHRMPKQLLEALARSSSSAVMHVNGTERDLLRAAFADVHELRVALEEVTKMRQVVTALDLANNVTVLTVGCAACPRENRQPLPAHWTHLVQHIPRLRVLRLEHFVLRLPALEQLVEALGSAHSLDTFWPEQLELGQHANKLGQALARLPEPKRLMALGLRANGLGTEAYWLPQLLPNFTSVGLLNIRDNGLGDAIGQELIESIKALPELWRVLVGGNRFRERTMKRMSEACGCEVAE
ncbi:unnamed protein product [Symbiodinium necroappetens]|uniref:Uncharacterized protein n=1 Tax=Symbiodinium necroappetens TaxID=1628268 RepID=A0A812Q722_9DINO|nr:unnamed protein product [Symbiodinium necroappetens]